MRHALALPFAVAAAVLFALTGCAAGPKDAGFGDVRREAAGRAGVDPDVVRWNRDTADDRAAADAVRGLLARPLTPDAAVQVALLNNATLQATYEDLGIAQADLVQAGLLKNPVFSFEVRFPADPKAPIEADVFYEFVSLLTMPLRQKVAAAQFEAAKRRVTGAVLGLAADARSAYYTLQGAEQMLEMRRQVAQATEASADAAREIRRAGNITELQLRTEEGLAAQSKVDLAAAEAEVVQDRERLNVLMGLWGPATQWTIPTRLPELPEAESPGAGLESLAVEQRPDLASAAAEAEAAGQSLGLSRAVALLPDATVGAHFEREPQGEKTLGPSIELPVPLFDQGQAQVARNEAMLRQARRRYAAMAVEARSQVRAAYAKVLAARSRAEYFRRRVLPLYARILEQTQLQYNAMQVGVFQLLQAKQSQIDAGRAYVEAVRDYWVAWTELEKAVGGRLPR